MAELCRQFRVLKTQATFYLKELYHNKTIKKKILLFVIIKSGITKFT